MSQEIWKPVVGFEWLYEVSNLGRLKSLARLVKRWDSFIGVVEKISYWGKTTEGYMGTKLCRNWIEKPVRIHRLVAESFIPNPEWKLQVNHIDWVKDNNTLENLEWCTNSENVLHGFRVLKRDTSHCALNGKKLGKPILQYTLGGEFIKEWASTMDIERALWFRHNNISRSCQGKYRHTWWFLWKYKNPQ